MSNFTCGPFNACKTKGTLITFYNVTHIIKSYIAPVITNLIKFLLPLERSVLREQEP